MSQRSQVATSGSSPIGGVLGGVQRARARRPRARPRRARARAPSTRPPWSCRSARGRSSGCSSEHLAGDESAGAGSEITCVVTRTVPERQPDRPQVRGCARSRRGCRTGHRPRVRRPVGVARLDQRRRGPRGRARRPHRCRPGARARRRCAPARAAAPSSTVPSSRPVRSSTTATVLAAAPADVDAARPVAPGPEPARRPPAQHPARDQRVEQRRGRRARTARRSASVSGSSAAAAARCGAEHVAGCPGRGRSPRPARRRAPPGGCTR